MARAVRIADISQYQEKIDWEKARSEIDFLICRASIGLKPDKLYLQHTAGYGKLFGTYHYVKAGTAQEARQEARFFVECANKALIRPTIYFADIEYETQTSATTETVCEAFVDELRALGCQRIGLYIGQTRYKWAGAAIAKCDAIWIPRYGKNDGFMPSEQYFPKYPCDLWQYTSKGRIDGIDGNVDLDEIWGDKPLEWFTGASDKTITSKGSGNMFTNLMLAAYCEKVYAAKWKYWYGTCGYKCTEAMYEAKKKQYPAHYTASRTSGYQANIAGDNMCADCVGLIKSFFWKGGDIEGKNVYKANNCPDVSANGMIELCAETGPISGIPDEPGLVVWKSGHIGVYIGNGYTIEMRGFAYDCVKRKVSEGPWTKWGRLPKSMISYETVSAEPEKAYALGERTLKKGMTGADVQEMQHLLMELGYSLPKYGADGDFGSETLSAVQKFQADIGTDQTGILDETMYKALMEAKNPGAEAENTDTPENGSEPVYVLVLAGLKAELEKIQAQHGGRVVSAEEIALGGTDA